MSMVHASVCLCLPEFLSSVLCNFLKTGLSPLWLGLFNFSCCHKKWDVSSWFLFLIFHCCCTKMPLISEYWLCIPLFLPNSFIRLSSFMVESVGFSVYTIKSTANTEVLLPPFQFGCLLFLFLSYHCGYENQYYIE